MNWVTGETIYSYCGEKKTLNNKKNQSLAGVVRIINLQKNLEGTRSPHLNRKKRDKHLLLFRRPERSLNWAIGVPICSYYCSAYFRFCSFRGSLFSYSVVLLISSWFTALTLTLHSAQFIGYNVLIPGW